MKVYDAGAIRNVAVVGHSGSGKTQLVSALLYAAGAVPRLGKVDDGTSVTDVDDEAITRKHSLSSSLAHAEWQGRKINIIDTPGIGPFQSEARSALRVVEAAVVVADAVHGAEVQTESLWAAAEARALPCLVVLGRLDRDRASLPRALDSLRHACARTIVPVHLPIGDGSGLTGIVDLVRMRAVTAADDDRGTLTETAVPPSMQEAADEARAALVEMVAETNDDLMEVFFATGSLTQDQLERGLRDATAGRRLFPLFCTASLRLIGVQPLLDALVTYVPSPAERPFTAQAPDGSELPVTPANEASHAALVWKTLADPFAGRISLLRVVTGTFTSDSTVQNTTRHEPERLGHLLLLQGKTQVHVPELRAGDLGAVAKLKDTATNDVLGDARAPIQIAPFEFPEPALAYAIEPRTRADEDKLSSSIHRLQEEDPTIRYTRDAETHDFLLSGQGQLHIEVTVARLKRRFGVDVVLKPPRIPYRETITASTEAHGRHKKQTGGHGQFGDCHIRVEPLPRGSDFEFADEIFGGAIPRQFVPAIEKGLQEARRRGYLAGYPMVDFRATVFDGSYHQVDSNELSFKMAASLAFKDAMARARPTLLEPVMQVEIHAPSECAGDLMGDLNGRRGRIAGMDTREHGTVIRAQVPMAEMLTYEQHLTSATGGRGSYHMEYSHYDEVPHQAQAKIIAAAKASRGGDMLQEAS